jgi:hypothetical protein
VIPAQERNITTANQTIGLRLILDEPGRLGDQELLAGVAFLF